MKNKKKSFHLTWQELFFLAYKIPYERQKEAEKHCEICIVCKGRVTNLLAYIEKHSDEKEWDPWIEEWAKAAYLLKQIESQE